MTIVLHVFQIFSILACYVCEKCENYTQKIYYPIYHLGPLISCKTKVGWMNDPNGFCIFKNTYHLFYQYNPDSGVSAGTAHWGHAKSDDLVFWKHLPIAIYPDQWYDRTGAFSGSTLVEDNTMYIFYTGNINHTDRIPNHEQHQNLVTSNDGEIFKKYYGNPIIAGSHHQPNFRDPKVWKHGDTYYMVLGNSFKNNTLGQVLLYTSKDKLSWKEKAVLGRSDGFLGHMWECPDFFELDGHFVLLFSPQGIKPRGDKYRNLYQTGYIVGCFDYKSNTFKETSNFKELDHGHDFYATQTILNKNGRRVLFAWMDMWKQNYPEGADGFTGQLTIPRVLKLTPDGCLLQQPIKAIKKAVGRKLHAGKGRSGTKVKLENNTGKVKIRTSSKRDFTLLIESEFANDTVKITYEYKKGRIALDRGGDNGVRRTKYESSFHLKMEIYIDRSSIELFCGCGEVTMSSRFFPKGSVSVCVAEGSSACEFSVNSMIRTVPLPCY